MEPGESQQPANLEALNITLSSPSERAEWLSHLVEHYNSLPAEKVEQRRSVRLAFLQSLQGIDLEILPPAAGHFLAAEIKPDDFALLEWSSPTSVLDYCEILSASHAADGSSQALANDQVRPLLRYALEWLESRNQIEQMFQVLQLAPISAAQYPELRRLRNRAYLYEKRRVQRIRRIIYSWLIFYALAVLLIFPVLFVNAENGLIQAEIEQATNLDSTDARHQFFTLSDGVYWSLITAGGIGYGDITPVTGLGKALSAALGAMGVITVGVIAGLILEWISPRSLE